MHLVTGGTGIVGTRILFDLIRSGERVRALKRSTSDLSIPKQIFQFLDPESAAMFEKIEWVDGDVTDVVSLENAMQDIETIYHAAAVVSFRKGDRKAMFKINVEGTANVCNVALGWEVQKICHISSSAALGRSKSGQLINELIPLVDSKLNSDYAITKHAAEHEIWRIVEEGLDAVVVNPSIIVGPGDFSRASAAMFSKVFQQFPFYPAGSDGFVGVRDVSSACIKLMQSDISGERFILNAENLTYKDFFSHVARHLGKEVPKNLATPGMLRLAYYAQSIGELLGGKKSSLTRQSLKNASNKVFYNADKIKDALEFEFEPVEKAIEDTAAVFKTMHNT